MIESLDRDQLLLEERARVLARPLTVTRAQDIVTVLSFMLARERYAVESREVWAVFRLRHFTRLPSAEPPLFGLTSWRGDVLTLLDLRPLLGAPATALDDLAYVVVLGDRRATYGLLADSVQDLVDISRTSLRPAENEHSSRAAYVTGITPDALQLLNPSALFSSTSVLADSSHDRAP
jgi:purine-binding chemotaxis protein CheW